MDDDYFASLGGSLMRDLLADLQVDEGGDGWLSLEQLEKELAHIDGDFSSTPTATATTPAPMGVGLGPPGLLSNAPPGLSMQQQQSMSAASIVVSHAQDRAAYAPQQQQQQTATAQSDAWKLSLERFSALSLDQDFLAADSARKIQQQHHQLPFQQQPPPNTTSTPASSLPADLLATAEDYDVTEKLSLPPPPGLGIFAGVPPPPGVVSNQQQTSVPAPPPGIKDADAVFQDGLLSTLSSSLEEKLGITAKKGHKKVPTPPTPQNSMRDFTTMTPQNSVRDLEESKPETSAAAATTSTTTTLPPLQSMPEDGVIAFLPTEKAVPQEDVVALPTPDHFHQNSVKEKSNVVAPTPRNSISHTGGEELPAPMAFAQKQQQQQQPEPKRDEENVQQQQQQQPPQQFPPGVSSPQMMHLPPPPPQQQHQQHPQQQPNPPILGQIPMPPPPHLGGPPPPHHMQGMPFHHPQQQVPPQFQPPPPQQPQQQMPPPPRYTKPVFCNPLPSARPIPAKVLESNYMKARDISYVIHAIMKPVLNAGISESDYDIQLLQQNNVRNPAIAAQRQQQQQQQQQQKKKNNKDPSSSDEEPVITDEAESRAKRSKEWSTENAILGHVAKTNVTRPRALIASLSMEKENVDQNKENQKQRASLWKSRIYIDQAHQAYFAVIDIFKSAKPTDTIPPLQQAQPHIIKLMKCLGINVMVVVESNSNNNKKDENTTATHTTGNDNFRVDNNVLSLFLKLNKGKTLLSRILDQALLPPRAVQELIPLALQVLYSNKNITTILLQQQQQQNHQQPMMNADTNNNLDDRLIDDRLFQSFTRVIQTLPTTLNGFGEIILKCLNIILQFNKVALCTPIRMECVHSLLLRGTNMASQQQQPMGTEDDNSFHNRWKQTETDFMNLLASSS